MFESICPICHALDSVFMVRCGVRCAVDFVEGILNVFLKLLCEFLMFFDAILINLPQNGISIFVKH
jgi:hypothetical protein